MPEQLDIFTHSRDVMLRNDVLQALQGRNVVASRAAWQVLAEACPEDPHLTPLDLLTVSLETLGETPLADHDALARERQALQGELSVAARQALGGSAGELWLRPMWHALAARSAHLPFQRTRPDDHAAALWLRGEQWAKAAEAVGQIESWRRIPAPLAWMAEARCRLDGLDACWPLLAELAWLAPGRLDALLRRLQDPLLARLHKKFAAAFDDTGNIAELAWFPAWVLTETPALAPQLAQAQRGQHSTAERGMRLMVELLGLERQGRHQELIQQRRSLRDLHQPLYAAYMATR